MRSRVEILFRAIAMLALAGLLWLVARGADAPVMRTIDADHLNESLARLSTRSTPAAVAVQFDTLPGPIGRDWLHALAEAGTRVSWSSRGIVPSAASMESMPEPERRTRVRVAVQRASMIALRDQIGTIDSVRAGRAVFAAPLLSPGVHIVAGGSRITAAPQDSALLRTILVIGKANWETKFAAAALEERGWKTEARINVAPGTTVENRSQRAAIDTAGYSAIIVLDSGFTTAIRDYVQKGGGIIAADTNAAIPEDAIALETKNGVTAIAATRYGNGRILYLKRNDTWKQRMSGEIEQHRAFWSGLVSSVAYAPRIAKNSNVVSDLTPYASTVAALGAPVAAGERVDGVERFYQRTVMVLFVVCLAGLSVEWLSRRARGLS